MFNCKEGKFPMSYLGFPIADRKLTIADMNYLVETVGHGVDPWQGHFSSVAARHILTNASLASLPSQCMGLFLLAEGTHDAFDKVLARFFWEGVGEKRKYHWLRWEECCVPQIMGGLGLTNTRAMNLALMLKWVWRILQPDTHNSLWFKILAAKYPNSISLFSSGSQGGSQFWNSILKIRHIFRSGARFHIQNGRGTRFWLDRWRGDVPLAAKFPNLFAIRSDQTISVNQALEAPHLNIHFRRSLSPADLVIRLKRIYNF
jgi:hypothetical protein